MGNGQLDLDHYPYNILNTLDSLERRVPELERFPAGTAGGGSGSMVVHDLDGVWHTGQIADDQAPQFIMHDGSRSFTGDQSLGEHNLTNVGDISLDSISPDAGTITMLLDNAQATALLVWDGTDTFLTLDTTVGVERVKVGQAMTLAGPLYLGAGEDTNLYRGAADVLRTDDSFRANRIGIGADPVHDLDIATTKTHTSGYQYGVELDVYETGGGNASIIALGAWAYGNAATTGTIRGFQMEAEVNADVANAEAGVFYVDLNSGAIGTVKTIRVVCSDTASVAVADFYHATIEANLLAAAAVTNEYGLWIGDVTRGSALAYSIYTGLGTVHFGGRVEVVGSAAGDVQMTVKGASSQTASLMEWLDSAATILLALDKDGQITTPAAQAVATGTTTSGNFAFHVKAPLGGLSKSAALVLYRTGSGGTWIAGGQMTTAAAGINFESLEAGSPMGFTTPGSSSTASITLGGYGSTTANQPYIRLVNNSLATRVAVAIIGKSAQSASLMEWQDSGKNVLASIGADGEITGPDGNGTTTYTVRNIAGTAGINLNSPAGIDLYLAGNLDHRFNTVVHALAEDLMIGFAGADASGAVYQGWFKVGAGIIGQRAYTNPSTNPQEYRIYNTYDGAGNDEFLSIGWQNETNILHIDAEATGTGTQRAIEITASTITLAPAGELILDPTGDDVLPGTSHTVNIGAYTNKYLTLHVAELWTSTLVAEYVLATIGGRILVGPTTRLTSDLTAVATTIYVEHNNLANGDTILLEANGSYERMLVTSAPSGTGPYSYTVTRDQDGSGANAWYAGDAVFNMGASGDGWIDIYSVQGIEGGGYGPTIVGNITGASGTWVPGWAIGNLNGLYGYVADTYGVALGKYSEADYMTIDPTNGIRFFDSGDNVVGSLSSAVWTLGLATDDHIEVSTASGIRFIDGTTITYAQWNGGDLYLGYQSNEHMHISATAVNFKDGGTTYASLTGTVWTLGITTDDHLEISAANGIRFLDGSSNVHASLNAGSWTLGLSSDDHIQISAANGIEFIDGSSAVQAQLTGSVWTIGRVASGYSNVQISSGALKLRQNTTDIITLPATGNAQIVGTLDVTSPGQITAGGGNVVIDANGIIMGYQQFGYLKWKSGGTTTTTIGRHTSGGTDGILLVSNNQIYDTETASQIVLDSVQQYAKDLGGVELAVHSLYGVSITGIGTMGSSNADLRIEDGLIVGTVSTNPEQGNIRLYNGGGNDPLFIMDVSGTTQWTVGIDDDDSDKFKINNSTTLSNPSLFEIDTSGNVQYTGDLKSYKNSSAYTGYILVPLPTPATIYGNVSLSSSSNGTLDLSSYGLPAGIKAVVISRSGVCSTAGSLWTHGPSSSQAYGGELTCQVNNVRNTDNATIMCNSSGDIYQVLTGSWTSCWMRVWGYYI